MAESFGDEDLPDLQMDGPVNDQEGGEGEEGNQDGENGAGNDNDTRSDMTPLEREKERRKRNGLMAAVNDGDEAVVGKMLGERKAEVDMIDSGGATPLMLACHQGNPQLVQLLLDYNASVSARTTVARNSVMHFAAKNGSEAVIKILMERDATLLDSPNKNLDTPLMMAVLARNHMAAGCILKYSTKSLDHQNKSLNTALHFAAKIGDLKLIKLLMDHGANVTLRNDTGQTALDLARVSKKLDCIAYLEEQWNLIEETAVIQAQELLFESEEKEKAGKGGGSSSSSSSKSKKKKAKEKKKSASAVPKLQTISENGGAAGGGGNAADDSSQPEASSPASSPRPHSLSPAPSSTKPSSSKASMAFELVEDDDMRLRVSAPGRREEEVGESPDSWNVVQKKAKEKPSPALTARETQRQVTERQRQLLLRKAAAQQAQKQQAAAAAKGSAVSLAQQRRQLQQEQKAAAISQGRPDGATSPPASSSNLPMPTTTGTGGSGGNGSGADKRGWANVLVGAQQQHQPQASSSSSSSTATTTTSIRPKSTSPSPVIGTIWTGRAHNSTSSEDMAAAPIGVPGLQLSGSGSSSFFAGGMEGLIPTTTTSSNNSNSKGDLDLAAAISSTGGQFSSYLTFEGDLETELGLNQGGFSPVSQAPWAEDQALLSSDEEEEQEASYGGGRSLMMKQGGGGRGGLSYATAASRHQPPSQISSLRGEAAALEDGLDEADLLAGAAGYLSMDDEFIDRFPRALAVALDVGALYGTSEELGHYSMAQLEVLRDILHEQMRHVDTAILEQVRKQERWRSEEQFRVDREMREPQVGAGLFGGSSSNGPIGSSSSSTRSGLLAPPSAPPSFSTSSFFQPTLNGGGSGGSGLGSQHHPTPPLGGGRDSFLSSVLSSSSASSIGPHHQQQQPQPYASAARSFR